ncbi:MAG: VWA domain-containing protein [Clostridia bacterium]|nr:VWA domain-containing protein [Clostridia bacterium]
MAAGAYVQTVVTQTQVVVVADVSYSAEKNLDTVDGYVKDLKKRLPRNSKMGVLCFGKDYKLVTPIGKRFNTVKNSAVDKTETNITSALEYAGTLFAEDSIKRIVLVTDGRQSDMRDSSSLRRTVDALTSNDIRVDAIYIDDTIPDTVDEVQITGVEYNENTFINHRERVTVNLKSNKEVQDVKIYIDKNGENIVTVSEMLEKGSASFNFNLDTSVSAENYYTVRIEAKADTNRLNNTYSFIQNVSNEISILFLTQESGDLQHAHEVYNSDNVTLDAYLVDSSTSVPYSLEDLCTYDEIILSNIDISQINHAYAFIDNLGVAVRELGKSLITYGNTYIQGSDNEILEKLNDMLPVRFGNSNRDPKLYTFVIDDSRSMELNYKMLIAKRAAEKIINDILNETDYVCVIKFDSDAQVMLTPQRLRNKQSVINLINNIDVRQGTVIGSGLKRAYEYIANFPFSEKQLMLISDGLTYSEDKDNPLDAVNDLVNSAISVSAIDVGRGEEDKDPDAFPNAAMAKKLLQDIASRGLGSYYYVGNSLENLENAVFNKILGDEMEMVVEAATYVDIKDPNSSALTGLNTEPDSYYVGGYYNNRAKSDASVVLTVEYKKRASTADVPLYAYWNHGMGKVASFASAFTGNWLRGFPESAANILQTNIADTNIPSSNNDYPYTVSVENRGSFAYVQLETPSIHKSATAKITVTLPDGTELSPADMIYNQGNVYYFNVALPSVGMYKLRISYNFAGKEYTADTNFDLPYFTEYDEFADYSVSTLVKAISVNGGIVSEDGAFNIVNDDKDVRLYTVSLVIPFAIAAAVLFIIDIAVRKLKWEDVTSFFRTLKRGKKSGKGVE